MTDRPKEFDGEGRQTNDVAPELHNSEQEDEEFQAQTLASERLEEGADDYGLEDSEKVPTGEEGGDVQDIVDHMRQMVSSGRIDNSAYAGEPNHDNEDDTFLPAIQPQDRATTESDGAPRLKRNRDDS
ncbi:hypothetical protein ABVV53_12400 [Novosphingobium sp. RD2P27]|uniref:Uncharacterized protein n=1 Tax=Novosphingobium kalidii TaxID=3230299 RepID=A0ABV2D312_9SPHN